MISPIKMSIIVCGAAAGLAVAPYVVKSALPPTVAKDQKLDTVEPNAVAMADEQVQLPVAGLTMASAPPAETQPAPVKPVVSSAPPAPAPELVLSTPAATPVVIASLPSLSAPAPSSISGDALPSPKPVVTPTPAPTPTPTPKPELPYRTEVAEAQKLLEKLGLSAGKIDGKLGPITQKVVAEFQTKNGLDTKGEVDAATIAALEKAVAALPPPPPPVIEVSPADSTDAAELAVSVADAGKVADQLPSLSIDDKPSADDPDLLVGRKGQLASAGSKKEPTEEAKPVVVPDPGPVPTLKQVKHVKQLQEKLQLAEVYDGNVDGKWGALTIEAMKKFQESQGLEVTGKPNKSTWLKMAEVAARKEAGAQIDSKDETVIVEVEPAKEKKQVARSEKSKKIEDIVVRLNADAGVSDTEEVKALATPAAVSTKVMASAADQKQETIEQDEEEAEAPRVKVAVPVREERKSEEPDTASIKLTDSKDTKQINDVIAAAKTQIQSVSNDPYYEAEKYAPKLLDSVTGLAEEIEQDLADGDSDAGSAEASLKKLKEELDKVKHEALARKAERKVKGVESAYDRVKKVFPKYLKAYPDKSESEKDQQEELAVLMSRIDEGFEAMNKDFKKGQYSRIVDRCDGFRTQIEILGNDLAQGYLKEQMEKSTVTAKLSRSAREEIKELQSQNKHFEAAQLLEKSLD